MRTRVTKPGDNTLRLEGEDLIVVALSKNHHGKFRWFSSIAQREGRTFFDTPDLALNAAAQSIGLEIV